MNNNPNDFDNYAKDYRTIHTNNVKKLSGKDSDYFSEYKIKEITDFVDETKKVKILDFGCGDGNSAKYFFKYFPKCIYSGIDISKKSIEIAQNRYNNINNADFINYDGETIPFDDCYFDVVFISCVMHHINSKKHKRIIKECRRVLKKGGLLIVFEHNPLNPLTVKTVNDCPFDADAVLMTSKYLKSLVKFIGFKSSVVRYTIFVPRKGIFEKLLGIEKYLYSIPVGGQYYIVSKK